MLKLRDLPEWIPEYPDPMSDDVLVAVYNAENQHTVTRNITVAEVAVMMLKEWIPEYLTENNQKSEVEFNKFIKWIEKKL